MKCSLIIYATVLSVFMSFQIYALDIIQAETGDFDKEKDLLLVQLDCKTDVDDLHTVAGLATILAQDNFSGINYHAVAGTYGIQEGLYVPPNPLFELAFGDNWTDAHENFDQAITQVKALVKATLENDGDIWIADAGQSDFSAGMIESIQAELPEIAIAQRIHVVQHSDWNEEVTDPEKLRFVQENANYHKIPDGNVVGNGSPGFRTPEYTEWKQQLSNTELIEIWQLAVDISNEYNGKDGRYHNEAISSGGLDFSDLAEVCYILGIDDIKDTAAFFDRFGQ